MDRATLLAFGAMVLGIGGNVVAVKYIARAGDLDPFWAASSRFAVATMLFAIIAKVVGARMPRGPALLGAMLYGMLTIGAFFAFAYWGLQEAPAGLAGIVLATGPLLTFMFALLHGQERFRWDSMAGAAIVIGGTAVILRAGTEEGVPVTSLLAILGASACAAEGAIVVKAFPAIHPAARNTIGMATGTVMLLVLMPLTGETFAVPTAGSTWGAQVYLITFGTVGVFGLYLFLLSRWTASMVSYEFVLAPVVAIALGAWLFSEQLTTPYLIGSLLVLGGVYLGAIRPARAASP